MRGNKRAELAGGVSIFIVIATFLMTAIIVASFIRLANRDNQLATSQDLSQSAYDSAQAGVEDAKRALLKWQKCDSTTASDDDSDCAKMTAALARSLNDQSCRMLADNFAIGDPKDKETIIQTTAGDTDFDQAYTCVKINTSTSDFLGEAIVGQSQLVPLKATTSFNKLRISWFNEQDAGSSDIDVINSPDKMTNAFAQSSNWPTNRPSVLRSEIIMGDDSRVLFAYPSAKSGVGPKVGDVSVLSLAQTSREFNSAVLQPTQCEKSLKTGGHFGYACSVVIDLGAEVSADSNALLRLMFQYGKTTNYKIEMLNQDNSVVDFHNVQPVIDSTGRANDQFRRIQARVDMSEIDQPIPDFTVSSGGQFCKTMIIRDQTKPSSVDCR